MRAFELDRDQGTPRTQELNHEAVETEHQLESWLHANPEVILNEPLLIFGRQYGLETGIPDLLALDQWGNVVVIELKKGQSGSGSASEETILSQPQNYAQSLCGFDYEGLENVYREYRGKVRTDEWDIDESAVVEDSLKKAHETKFGSGLAQSDFNAHQRIVILAEEITSRTENNARYLLEQGLAVQCVSVQWFQFTREATANRSLLVSSAFVDYPLSRVKPADDKVDYSDLLLKVRDRLYPEIAELCHFEEPGDMHRTGTRQLGFGSDHPEHPGTVRYRFKPRIVEEGRTVVSLGVWGANEEEKDSVREVVAEHAAALEGFEATDEYEPASNLIYATFEELDQDPDEDFFEAVMEKMTEMIRHNHPKLVNEV